MATLVIHINQHTIRRNAKHGTREPCVTFKRKSGGPATVCHQAVIVDPSGNEVARVVYRPEKPLSYGGGFRVNYNHHPHVTAIDGVFHVLDGKGVMREHPGPLSKAIDESADGRGETEYFRFKCFKNGNLHLEMKRLDLVRELNLLATGQAVLGDDMTE